jgi:hypothetical protein
MPSRRFPSPWSVEPERDPLSLAMVCIIFKVCVIGAGAGRSNMPHIGPVLEGRTFFCPHCGALYSAAPSLVPKIEGDAAKCVVCLKVMDSLDTTKVPSFKLIQRHEDA